MENRRVYVCPNCKSWYSHEKNMFSPEADRKESICPNCQRKLVETDIDYEEFSAMAKEEKQRVKQQYLDTHELPVTPHAEAEDENSASGWISGLKIFSWVSSFAIIIAGLVLSIPYFNYSYSHRLRRSHYHCCFSGCFSIRGGYDGIPWHGFGLEGYS